jgi:hypothetical protein
VEQTGSRFQHPVTSGARRYSPPLHGQGVSDMGGGHRRSMM